MWGPEKKILWEEETEEREVDRCRRMMEDMQRNCREMDPEICRLIEEQRNLLGELREEKRRHLDDLSRCRTI